MIIIIESDKKQSKIENIEWEDKQITFFFSNFFYLNFENDEEKNKFFSEFLINSENKFSEGQSYVELGESLIGESHRQDNIIIQDTTELNVKSYRFIKQENYLVIEFTSGREDLKFILFQPLINKILDKIK